MPSHLFSHHSDWDLPLHTRANNPTIPVAAHVFLSTEEVCSDEMSWWDALMRRPPTPHTNKSTTNNYCFNYSSKLFSHFELIINQSVLVKFWSNNWPQGFKGILPQACKSSSDWVKQHRLIFLFGNKSNGPAYVKSHGWEMDKTLLYYRLVWSTKGWGGDFHIRRVSVVHLVTVKTVKTSERIQNWQNWQFDQPETQWWPAWSTSQASTIWSKLDEYWINIEHSPHCWGQMMMMLCGYW